MSNLFERMPLQVFAITSFFYLGSNIGIHAQTVDAWLSNAAATQQLQPQPPVSFQSDAGSQSITINVDPSITYQTMDGFGAAMTGSAAYNVNQRMTGSQRDALMNDLFTSNGIRLSMVRHTIGASDFNLGSYTYNDMPPGQTDPSLNNFSIAYDETDIIPALQLAKQKNPDLKIMGSPWSAPAWMKEVHNLNGGWLDITWYKTYADYLVKYVQAYEAHGLPIWAISLQNEPLHETSSYPSMRMDAGNQISFLKNDIGPAFSNAGLSTGLMVYDHNWDRPDYPVEVLNDPAARAYTIGTGFHAYAGTVDAQTTVHNAHPDKGIWFTEISGGDWSTHYGNNLKWNMTNIIIGATRNWGKGILLWNLALDENDGPTNGGCSNCRGVVTINSVTGAVTKEVEYYVLGHISKFVYPGAVRISSDFYSSVQNVVFKNPDGSIALIAFNNSNKPNETFKVKVGSQSFAYTLEKGAAVTFKWEGTGGGGNTPPAVAITSPANGATYNAPADISIIAGASDADGRVARVDFYDGSNLLGTDTSSPFGFEWTGVAVGTYTLTAIATDNGNAQTTSAPVGVTVNGGASTSMHVASIITSTVSAGQGNKKGVATVTVADNNGTPVNGATVTGTFSGSYNETASAVTNSSGVAELVTTATAKGGVTVNFCVDNLDHTSLTYNSGTNTITCTGGSARTMAEETVSEELAVKATVEALIYPNPVRDRRLTIDLHALKTETASVKVSDLGGKLWMEKELKEIKSEIQLPKAIPAGIYVVSVISEGKKATMNIAVE